MSLQNDLIELAVQDRRVVKALVEQDRSGLISAIRSYQKLRRNIRIQTLDQAVVALVEPDAIRALQKITTGNGLPTDAILAGIYSSTESGEIPDEFDDWDMESLGSDIFYSWFSDQDYVRGLADLRPLAVKTVVGDSVHSLIQQIKSCYAFQQYEATYSLCRTAIEVAIRDICVKRNLIPDQGANVILFEKYNWGQLRDKVSSGEDRKQLSELYADLSVVLHGRKLVSKIESRHAFENTLRIIERIYEAHGL